MEVQEDLDVYFVDDKGEEKKLDVSLAVEILGSKERSGTLRLRRRPQPRAGKGQAGRSPLATEETFARKEAEVEAATRGWHWMTDGGSASAEDVRKVQREIEKKGGRIVSCSDSAVLINHVGCDLRMWDEVVDNFVQKFSLDNKAKTELLNAQYRDTGEGMDFQDTVEGAGRTATYTAYRTVRDEARQKISIIYGRNQLSMEVVESGFAVGKFLQLRD